MTTEFERDLRTLPKAHLHLHLEGAMRRSTLQELAERYGVPLPSTRERYDSFADFQALYLAATEVLRTWDDLGRLIHEVAEDAARDGAVWIEPATYLPRHFHLGAPEAVVEFLLASARDARERTGVDVGWMVTADRTRPPEDAEQQAELAARYASDGVVAFGLANDEASSPPERFARAFDVAIAAGLISTPHAGEHRGPESVAMAMEALGARRIQHGIRCREDPALVEQLASSPVCLDVCPTSNVALSVVPAITEHPLKTLLERGVKCSINADDPLLFDVGLLDEYELCRNQLQITDALLADCARNSLRFSGAPDELKHGAEMGIDVWMGSR
jgi:adenosine deaminase